MWQTNKPTLGLILQFISHIRFMAHESRDKPPYISLNEITCHSPVRVMAMAITSSYNWLFRWDKTHIINGLLQVLITGIPGHNCNTLWPRGWCHWNAGSSRDVVHMAQLNISAKVRAAKWPELYHSCGPLPVISTYNPIYNMYNPTYNQL